ncbi:MAG: cell division protein FtsZ [Candidatus Uhrbacteria bacterium]
MAEVKPKIDTFAKIKVIGVGGGGGSALNRMIRAKLRGVEFVAANTDLQALHHNLATTKVHLGKQITRGLGAGMDPDVGRKAAEENQNEIRDALKGTDMVFITCGLGGGTGSGAGPVIAEIARDLGCLTIGVVTRPFSFEGAQRASIAEQAYAELRDRVDALVTIPNDRILSIIDKKTSLLEAFDIVDDILKQGVRGIAELITTPGEINVDFADVKAIMRDAGSALMGIGSASGENRAVEAAKAAVASPLLEVSIEGARGILFTIMGDPSLSMHEVHEAAEIITSSADPNAKIIFGTVIDETAKDEVRITVIATGFDSAYQSIGGAQPEERAVVSDRQAFRPPKYFGRTTNPGKRSDIDNERPLRTMNTREEVEEPEDVPVAAGVNDELEIPTFIRRKLG